MPGGKHSIINVFLLEAMRYTINGSAALIRQLLGFVRRQTIVPEMIDINQTISEMMPMLSHLIRKNISAPLKIAFLEIPIYAQMVTRRNHKPDYD